MGRLDRKVALITGGNTGIVRAIALAFHREGASVVIGYVAKKKEAESLVRVHGELVIRHGQDTRRGTS